MNNQNDLNNMINTNNRFINADNNQPVNNNENTTQHSSMLSSTPNYNSSNLDNLVEEKPSIDTSHLDMRPQVDSKNDFILSSKSMEAMSENTRPMDEGLSFDKKAFIILVIILLIFIYFMPNISEFIENIDW